MVARFRTWSHQFLLAADQMGLILIQFFTYALLGRGDPPNADETISSRVGRAAMRQKKWALIAEKVINALFWFSPDHCRRCIGS